jgi:hypothetical protein
MKKILICLLLIVNLFFMSNDGLPQSQATVDSVKKEKPCSSPEARQLDFWIGEWDLSWGEDGKGTNVIKAIYDGCVILENFDGTPSMPLKGMSISTYSPISGQWNQTWVDNSGGYLDFSGGLEGEKMILSRNFNRNEKDIHQRMVWYNISNDQLDWNWERSDDGGSTWKVMWKIHYQRRK